MLADRLKGACEDNHVTIFATAEYKKIDRDGTTLRLPADDDVADSRTLQYRPNAICHIYNDVNDRPGNPEIFHLEDGRISPRLLMCITKNKISNMKHNLVFDLSVKNVCPHAIDYDHAWAEYESFMDRAEAGVVKIVNGRYIEIEAGEYDE